jgi:peptide/nickel transport system permease protein
VLDAVLILATLDIATVILAEASLSFIGAGVSAETISWGSMIADGRNFLTIAWWLTTIPGIAIVCVSLLGNLLGDWVRDALDPRLRGLR